MRNVASVNTRMPSNEPRRSAEYARSVEVLEKRWPIGVPANTNTVTMRQNMPRKIARERKN